MATSVSGQRTSCYSSPSKLMVVIILASCRTTLKVDFRTSANDQASDLLARTGSLRTHPSAAVTPLTRTLLHPVTRYNRLLSS
ncbi:hypothetical protein J6590_014340 [Homalodisca vitripennis]|nr:hypothetical protein J6590_014340 [Homalodisca vitripennis]